MTTLITLALVFLNVAVFPLEVGTPQLPDILVIDGAKYRLHTNPLEPFFRDHPDLRPDPRIISTSNWRRYVAEWAIVDGKFMLTDIKAYVSTRQMESVLVDVFPGHDELLAEWYSGHLIVPIGELISYTHLNYASRFSEYIIITVIDGVVVERRDLSLAEYDEFRNRQFELYQRTDDYREAMEELSVDSDEMDLEAFLFDVMTGVYTSIVFEEY